MPTLAIIVAFTVILIGGLSYWTLKYSNHPWFKHPPIPEMSPQTRAKIHKFDVPKHISGVVGVLALVAGFVVPENVSPRIFGVASIAFGCWLIVRSYQQWIGGTVTSVVYGISYYGAPAKIGFAFGFLIGAFLLVFGMVAIFR